MMLSAGAAQAAITTSNITSPATGGYLEGVDSPSPNMLTVTGTSDGTTGDFVRIRCWYANGSFRNFLSTAVPVAADGSFSATAPTKNIGGRDCRLRAEPTSVSGEHAAFTGPRLAVSEFDTIQYTISDGPNAGDQYDYYANGTTFGTYSGWDSVGDCGPYGRTLDTSYALSPYAIECEGNLYGSDGVSRSEIQVDGKNAYAPDQAISLFGRSGGTCPPTCDGSFDNSGFPMLTVSQNWNASNGFESTSETDGIVECTGADGYLPPNQAACPSFQDSGVQLRRAISMTGPNTIKMTDVWSSTDGHAHTVDALYDDYVDSLGSGAGYQFPGEPGFSRHTIGDVIGGASSAPGSIFVHTDIAALDGDPNQNYGSITFSSAPSQFMFKGDNEFNEHQTLSVPAGGTATLTYYYSFGTTLAQVQALAYANQDQIRSPAVSITSPLSGTKTTDASIGVSGTASSGSGISSLTVGGHAVSVGSNGSWSTSVALAKGANTITATATDNAGQSASANVTVIYAQKCVVPRVKELSRSKAEKKIRAAGCLVGKIKKKHSKKVKKGHAVGTNPAAGKTLKPGAKIELIISEGR
jgi:hypothetical protein